MKKIFRLWCLTTFLYIGYLALITFERGLMPRMEYPYLLFFAIPIWWGFYWVVSGFYKEQETLIEKALQRHSEQIIPSKP